MRFHDYKGIEDPREPVLGDVALSEVEAAYEQAVALKKASKDRITR
jgi:hypothetical protein